VLDAEAKLNGALVKLNCGPADAAGAARVVDKSKSGKASFKVLPDGLAIYLAWIWSPRWA
jgi:hypothetical protein